MRRAAVVVGASLLALSACASEQTARCEETPTSDYQAGSSVVRGKGEGDVFLYMYPGGRERVILAGKPEKFLVFLRRIPEVPPAHITVRGREVGSSLRATFEAQRHESEFGTEWGTNFVFPRPGCWELAIDAGGNRGTVVLRVE